MGKKSQNPLDVHVRFNGRNPRHVKAAGVLASIPNRCKTAFLTLAIESYMVSRYPMGVKMDELVAVQKETDRSFQPKAPIGENLKRPPASAPPPPAAPPPEQPEGEEVTSAIDKALAVFGVK